MPHDMPRVPRADAALRDVRICRIVYARRYEHAALRERYAICYCYARAMPDVTRWRLRDDARVLR